MFKVGDKVKFKEEYIAPHNGVSNTEFCNHRGLNFDTIYEIIGFSPTSNDCVQLKNILGYPYKFRLELAYKRKLKKRLTK